MFQTKGHSSPSTKLSLLKQINDYVEQEFFNNQENLTKLYNLNSVRLAIIKDKIYLKFS
jgi:hypothetical protein